jgi:integrase
MKLTAKSVATVGLPAGRSDHTYFDDDIAGFGLRIRAGGSRVFIYRYRVGKRQRSITLGSATSVPLALARKNAGELEAKVRLGRDPAADKATARAAAGDTIGALIDQYLDARMSDWRPNSLRQVKRHLLIHCKPLHHLPITSLSQRDVARLQDHVAQNSGETTSNRLRASLETFVAWVIRQGIRLPEGNVVSYTGKRKETTRERVLTDAELKAVWNACDDATDHSSIVRLLMLTGQRAAEIGSLQWSEVKDGRIELPSDRTKNKRPHNVPLSDPARAILEPLRMIGRTHVFGRTDSRGFKGWGVSKQRLDARIGVTDWVVHDLRRTVATRMAELGVQPHIVEAVLNHVSGHKAGVAGIYNRATYDKEKRIALDLWAAHILALVEEREPTVVPMKRGA